METITLKPKPNRGKLRAKPRGKQAIICALCPNLVAVLDQMAAANNRSRSGEMAAILTRAVEAAARA